MQSGVQTALEVYKAQEGALQAGDVILWRKNDESRHIINGEKALVTGVNVSDKTFSVLLDNGQSLTLKSHDSRNQHWDYSYCITSYMAQSATINHVLAHVRSWGGGLHSLNALLVMASRGNNFQLYTDDKKQYLAALTGSNDYQNKIVNLPKTGFELLEKDWPMMANKLSAMVSDVRGLTKPETNIWNEYHTSYNKEKNPTKQHNAIYEKPLETKINGHTTTNGHKQPNAFIDKEVLIDRLHQDIAGLAISLLGEPNRRTATTLSWGRKGSIQVHISGGKAGYWMNFEEGIGGKDMLSLYLSKTGLSFKEGIKELSQKYGHESLQWTNEERQKWQQKNTVKAQQEAKIEAEKRAWRINLATKIYHNESTKIEGTIAEKYLKNRGIDHIPSHFKFHSGLSHQELKGQKIPAMIAPIQDEKGVFKGIVRTYLEPNGDKLNRLIKGGNKQVVFDKNFEPQKAMSKADLGTKKGGFVLVNQGKNNEKIYLAEGIETALSVANVRQDCTVLAVLSVQNFRSVMPFKDTKNITLCADQDGAGSHTHKPFLQAAQRFVEQGHQVSIALPRELGNGRKLDFNDVLIHQGKQGIENSLSQAVTLPKDFSISQKMSNLDGVLSEIKQQQNRPVVQEKNRESTLMRDELRLS
jgi:hypothetical protein